MPKTEKVEKVEELKRRIAGSQAMFLADFRGLTVTDVSELRRAVAGSGTRFAVVKNTLMRRAAGEAGTPDLGGLLEGPTAVAFVDGDPVAAAKSLVEAVRRFRTMSLKGGLMEGRVLSAEQAQALSTIEPREVLLARMAGLAQASLSRAAYMFQALQSRFLVLLDAYREKLPTPADEVPAAEEAAEAAAPETPEEQGEQPSAEPPTQAREQAEPEAEEAQPEAEEAEPEAEQAEPEVEEAEPEAEEAESNAERAEPEAAGSTGDGAPEAEEGGKE